MFIAKYCIEPIDVFAPRFRRYQNGKLMPTSYGDHLDRAAKSLCKDIHASVSIELFNTQAIKVLQQVVCNLLEGNIDKNSRC